MRSYKIAVPKAPEGDETEEAPPVSEEKIKADMRARNIKFDLTREDRYWYKNPEKFWEEFKDTSEIKVPEKFEDWLIGQERVKREARLQLEEWVRKLKDTQNQYLWQPGLAGGEPDRILDIPYVVSEFAPNTFTTGLYVLILGDISFYWIAEALDMEIQRLVELYAEANQVGFIGRAELDGMPTLAEAFIRGKLA